MKTGELPILSRNPELLKRAVTFLKGNPEMAFVALYDDKGKLLINEGINSAGAEAGIVLSSGSHKSFVEKKDHFDFLSPVFSVRSGGDIDILQGTDSDKPVTDTIGWVRIGFSKTSMKKAEAQIVFRGLMLGLIFLAAGMSVLRWPVYFLVRWVKGIFGRVG